MIRLSVPAIATIALLSLLAGCDNKQAEAPPPVRPVLSEVVQPVRPAVTRFTGTVEPRYEAQLGFQATGRMISRDVNVGDTVHKGQQLATLDPTVPRLAVASAEADLANAEAVLVNAAATLDRQQQLIKMGSVSQAQLDTAVASRDTARARTDQLTAALAKAREQLGYAVLRSDYDGVVASWSAEVGQVVSASQTVAMVARPDPRDAVFDIPDERVALFPPGARFRVSLYADPTVTAEAVVREIAPQSDAATRSRRIRLTLDGPPASFRLGATVQVAVTEAASAELEIPDTAVLRDGAGTSVWLVSHDLRAETRAITVGPAVGTRVPVAAGLAPGDRVITAGVHSLSPGQAVKLAD